MTKNNIDPQNSISSIQRLQTENDHRQYQLQYYPDHDINRYPYEQFIQRIFKKYYNVVLTQFYPDLIAVEDKSHSVSHARIRAVAGIRCAADEPLFSEYYLQHDLILTLQNLYQTSIKRDEVIEVGNLAPASVGQMRWLIAALNGFLYAAGYRYIVFTAIPSICNAFSRMNAPLQVLARATQDCLPRAQRQIWGKAYYKLNPVVVTGDIQLGYHLMKRNIYQANTRLIPLFEQSCALGHSYATEQLGGRNAA